MFVQCTLRKNIYTSIRPAYYIILPIYVESITWQYNIMATLRGSYIVDIVSRARLLLLLTLECLSGPLAVASEDTTARQWWVKTRLRGSGKWSRYRLNISTNWLEVTAKVHSESTAKSKVTQLKHGDISRTIFSRCNGAREDSENISTAKFFTFTVYTWCSVPIHYCTHFHS